jgi:hypothetical protein
MKYWEKSVLNICKYFNLLFLSVIHLYGKSNCVGDAKVKKIIANVFEDLSALLAT